MPNQDEIKTTINIDANITNVEKAVGEIRKQMGQLQLGKGMQTGLAELYANFEQNFKRMRELTEGGKLKLVDEKEFSKTAANISSLWDKLMKQVSAAGVDVKPLAKYQSALNNLNSQSKNYQKETKQAANDLAKAQQKQTNLEQNLVEAQKKAKALTEEKLKKAKAVADALKIQEQHQEAINKAEKEGVKKTSNGYDKRYNTGKEANAAVAQLPQDAENVERLKKEYQDIVGEINRQSQAINKVNVNLNNQKREVEQLQNSYDEIAKDSIAKIVQELQRVENVDWQKIGVDLNSIDSWDKLKATIEDLNSRGLKEAADAISNVSSIIVHEGAPAVRSLGQDADKASNELHHMSETGKEIDALTNRIKHFFSIGNAAMLFRRAIRSAYSEIKELDRAMTETAVVTNMTVGDLWKMLPQYTKRANELGVSIQQVYEADTLYYQQGLKTNEVMAVSNETMKMARIAGLDAAEATDRMTNALRGFNMEITTANSQNINDVYSQLAARTASNVDEISTAMTKVASLAHSANMEFENTAAFLAQIIETTRESAETAGTALKTVVARFSEVKNLYSKDQLLGTDEEGQEIDVNKVSTALRSAGINLNEYLTGAKGLDQIFMELSAKWDSLDIVQQRYIATMAAGSRQQSRFIALMQDYNRMTELTTLANNAAGASNEQFQKTQESLASMLSRLQNAWTEFLFGLVNTDAVKVVIKILTDLLNVVNDLTNGFGPATKSILKFFAAFGTFKIGKSLFNNLFATLSKQFVDAGKKAGASYEGGFKTALSKFKLSSIKSALFGKGNIIDPNQIKTLKNLNGVLDNVAKNQMSAEAAANFTKVAYTELGFTEESYARVKQLANSEEELAIILSDKETGTKLKEAAANKTLSKTEYEQLAAEAKSNQEKSKGILLRLADTAASKFQQMSDKNLIKVLTTKTLALFGVDVAQKAATVSGYALLGVWGAFLVIIGLLIYGLIRLIKHLNKVAYDNSYEGKLEKLTELTKTFQEQTESAQNTIDSLQDSKSTYDELADSTKGLINGSSEWNEALRKNNEEVLKLIEKYPKLASYVRDVNGKLQIDEGGFDTLIAAQQQIVQATQIQQAQANVEIATLARGKLEEELQGMAVSSPVYSIWTERGQKAQNNIQTRIQGLHEFIDDYIEAGEKLDKIDLSKYSSEFIAQIRETGDAFREQVSAIKRYKEELAGANTAFNMTVSNLINDAAGTPSNLRSIVSAIYNQNNNFDDQISEALQAYTNLTDSQLFSRYTAFNSNYSYNGSKLFYEGQEVEITDQLKESFKKLLATNDVIKKAVNEYRPITQNLQTFLGKNTNFTPDLLNKIVNKSWSSLTGQEIQVVLDTKNEDMPVQLSVEDRQILSQAGSNNPYFTSLQLGNLENAGTGIVSLYGQDAKKTFNDFISSSISYLNTDELKSEFASVIGSFSDVVDGNEWFLAINNFLKTADISIEVSDAIYKAAINLAKELNTDFISVISRTSEQINLISSNLQQAVLGELDARKVDIETYEKLWKNSRFAQQFYQSGEGYAFKGTQQEYENLYASEQSTNALNVATAYIDALNTQTEYLSEPPITPQTSDQEQLTYNSDSKSFDWIQLRGISTVIGDALSGIDYRNNTTIASEWLNNGKFDWEKFINSFGEGAETIREEVASLTEETKEAIIQSLVNTGVLQKTTVSVVTNQEEIDAQQKRWEQAANEVGTTYSTLTSLLQNSQFTDIETLIYLYNQFKNSNYPEIFKAVNDALLGLGYSTDDLIDVTKDYEESSTHASRVTLANAVRDYKAIDELTGNFKLWKIYVDTLNEFEPNTKVYQNTLKNLARETGLSVEYLQNNFDVFTKALEGDINAIEQLQNDYIIEVGFDVQLHFDENGLLDMSQVNEDTFERIKKLVDSGYYDWQEVTAHSDSTVTYPVLENNELVMKTLEGGGDYTYYTPKKADISQVQLATSRAGTRSNGKTETHNWLTGLDKYYNLTAAINEQLRKREKMEREYDRMLERREGTYENLKQSLLDQQASLRREIALQQQLQTGRAEQLTNAANEKIQWKEGYSTYAAVGAANYAHWDEQNHQVVINWDAIHAITDEDLGGTVEAYISKLEEYEKGWEETESTIEDMDDKLYEINERGKDQYLELQERVIDALVKQRQLEIDELQNISDEMNEMNSDIISNIQESIELERQIRDNTKKEEEISDLENRLEYLRRDTSGANQVAILETQEKLEEARQQYTDSLIDQTINQMQDDNEKAQEQREKQIQLMTDQLEWDKSHGNFNAQMYELIKNAWGEDGSISQESGLYKLLTANDTFGYLTTEQQMKWLDDMLRDWKEAMVGEANFRVQQAEKQGFVSAKQNTFGEDLTFDSKTRTWKTASGKTLDSFGWDAESDRYTGTIKKEGPVITPNSVGNITPPGGPSGSTGNRSGDGSGGNETPKTYSYYDEIRKAWVGKYLTKQAAQEAGKQWLDLAIAQLATASGNAKKEWDDADKDYKYDVSHYSNDPEFYGDIQRSRAIAASKELAYKKAYQDYLNSLKWTVQIKEFATGGLNTSTGPAWLDGTASKPEYVLNARDTQVYLTLTNLLNKLLSNTSSMSDSTSSGGDNYFNIDINVDELGSDYDVDQLMERIKSQIVDDAMYRNVNVINLHR